MKKRIYMLIFVMMLCLPSKSEGQCAMCKINAENSTADGEDRARGVNAGILLLLASPYFAATIIGGVWYSKYRKQHKEA